MGNRFFEKPILNSSYDYPAKQWGLDSEGQPTQQIIESRRSAQFIALKQRKRKGKAIQQSLFAVHDLKSQTQQYDPTPIINELRPHDLWRSQPNPADRQVTPETARLLQHWCHEQYKII